MGVRTEESGERKETFRIHFERMHSDVHESIKINK